MAEIERTGTWTMGIALVAVAALVCPGCNGSAPAANAGTTPTTDGSGQTTTTEQWILKGYAVGRKAGNEIGAVSMSEILRLDDGRYRMYYGHAEPTGSAIKYAESADGVSWSVKGVVLQGTTDPTDREYVITGPSLVRLPDKRYRMYYQSSPQMALTSQQAPVGEEPKLHVRSAVSTDGLRFTREGVRIEVSSVDPASPLKLAGHGTYFTATNGTYVGIFSGNFKDQTGPSDLVMGTSSDGLTFGSFTKLYEDWHDPIVLKTTAGFRMYATYLLEKQGTALSADGVTWPAAMTDVRFSDGNGTRLTEGSSGVGDYGGVVLASGAIRLFSNFGVPSNDIVCFEQ